jgi:hypothetical protein
VFHNTGFDDLITRIALPLYGQQGNTELVLGTCIMVTDRLGFTARHVLDGYLEHFGFGAPPVTPAEWLLSPERKPLHASLSRPGNLDVKGSFALGVFEVEAEGTRHSAKAVFRSPSCLTPSDHTDLCILEFEERPSGPRLPRLRVAAFGADPGSDVAVFGYTKSVVVGDYIQTDPRTSTGRVEERLPGVGRRLPFPVLRTSARVEGGMSGGGAFSHGALCGFACDGLAFGETEAASHMSHLTLLAPALATALRGPVGAGRMLYDVLTTEGVEITDGHRIKKKSDGALLLDLRELWTQ